MGIVEIYTRISI